MKKLHSRYLDPLEKRQILHNAEVKQFEKFLQTVNEMTCKQCGTTNYKPREGNFYCVTCEHNLLDDLDFTPEEYRS